MNPYISLGIGLIIAALLLFRHIKQLREVQALQKTTFPSLASGQDDVYQCSDEMRMNILSSCVIALGIAMFWLKDGTPFMLTRLIAVILLAEGFGILLQSQQLFRMYYNTQSFMYLGRLFHTGDISHVSISKIFLKPSQVYFRDGRKISLFKKGALSLKTHFNLEEK